MTDWRNEVPTCACGMTFKPRRDKQRHCSASCRDLAKKKLKRSGDKPLAPSHPPLEAGTRP